MKGFQELTIAHYGTVTAFIKVGDELVGIARSLS